MKAFFDRLSRRALQANSLLCVGLDPHPEDLEKQTGAAAAAFCRRLIEETEEYAAAYKPNAAFFEMLGPAGFEALQEVIRFIPDGIPVILDIKRGDISSTARAYAISAFERLGADAVTLNAFLGRDSVKPFLDFPGKGAFVLCKTSNPGAGDFQDLRLIENGRTLYQEIAARVRTWGDDQQVGLVIGATQVDSLTKVRERDDRVWVLAPGIGPQGGNLRATIEVGLRKDGLGLLFPVSRAISRSGDPGEAARDLRNEINRVREEYRSHQPDEWAGGRPLLDPLRQEIAIELLELGCVQFGEFQLKSGKLSPIYLDLRRLIHRPKLMEKVASAYQKLLSDLVFDHLAALPYAALPITTAVSLIGSWSMIYPRKEVKKYGTEAAVEGLFQEGDQVVVVDDLITTGGSKLEAIQRLERKKLQIKDIVVLIDRSRQAADQLAARGYRLHSYLKLEQLLEFYQNKELVDEARIQEVRQFLFNSE